MKLSDEEQAMLAGDQGRGVQKAMEIITALGKIYGADDLVPVSSVQISGVSYKNLGDAGLEFLAEWRDQGAQVRVPTNLNPAGLDLQRWQELGFDASFAAKQQRVIEAFAAMGVTTTCTCTPYLIGQVPRKGDHIAWAESSAVSFANSVLGARTNREGGPGALAAAIVGRTARYGLHLAQNRRASLVVDVRCRVDTFSDFGALGTMVGRIARSRIPYFIGIELPTPKPAQHSRLKLLGAAMAASGAVALYYIRGITPEADDPEIILPGAETLVIESLEEGYASLNSDNGDRIDMVWVGCPHASLDEIAQVFGLLNGRRVTSPLWITTARMVKDEADKLGLVTALETLGARVVADTCVVVAPIRELGYRRIATPSAKGAYYVPAHSGMAVRYGSLEACVEAAVTGQWVSE